MPGDRLARVLAALTAGRDGAPAPLTARLCGASVRMLGVSGAALALVTERSVWVTLCSSDDVAGQLEDLQFTLGEGPGLDAHNGGWAVLEPDLGATGGRWPAFTEAASTVGVRAVFAFPMRIGVIRVGVLGLYQTEPGPLTGEAFRDALVLADLGAQAVLVGSRAGELEGQLADHGGLRAEVHQATGMLAAQGEVAMEEAFVRLRAHAYATGRRIGEVASDVVARRLRLDDL